MAVENKYVDSNLAAGTFADASYNGGIRFVKGTFEVAAADDDASIYRLARINSSEVLLRATLMCDAITGGTDYDLGLYEVTTAAGSGAVVDKDLFMDGQTFASATKTIDGLNSTTLRDSGKSYDIALTANTVGTAAGTITYFLEIANIG
jgi:hypothetical protein